MNIERAESLNDSPIFIRALADLVADHLKKTNGKGGIPTSIQMSLRCPGCKNKTCKDQKEWFSNWGTAGQLSTRGAWTRPCLSYVTIWLFDNTSVIRHHITGAIRPWIDFKTRGAHTLNEREQGWKQRSCSPPTAVLVVMYSNAMPFVGEVVAEAGKTIRYSWSYEVP